MPQFARSVERRRFLRDVLTTAGAAAALPALSGLNLLALRGRASAPRGRGGYGPLVPTPDQRDGVNRIALPEGFAYRSFSPSGATMSDGRPVPIAHDGMGVFNMPDGRFRLVRNHEDRNGIDAGASPPVPRATTRAQALARRRSWSTPSRDSSSATSPA